MAVKQPCLQCGVPCEGARCAKHRGMYEVARQRRQQAVRSSGGGAARPYRGDYARRAAEVRASTVLCWLCGEGWRADDPWQADHVTPGDPLSELRGAHRSCNVGRANRGRSDFSRGGVRRRLIGGAGRSSFGGGR